MIPVVSISNLISALIFGGITSRLYFSYRKAKLSYIESSVRYKKTEDVKLRNFFRAYLFLTLALSLLATPGLAFTDLKIIGLVFSLYPSFLYISFIYLGLIPLRILGLEKIKKIFLWGMIINTALITILNIINWGPAVFYSRAPFVYWEDTRGEVANTIIGVMMGLGLLLVIIFFILHALRASDKYVRIRAFLIAGSLGLLMLVGLVNFVFGASPGEYKYISSMIAASLGVVSAFVLLFGIFYKYNPSDNVPLETKT